MALEDRMKSVEKIVRQRDAIRAPGAAANRRQLIFFAIVLLGAYPALLTTAWALNAWEYHQLGPLHRAAYDGDVALCERIVKAGLPVDATDANGDTPLQWAVFRGRVDAVRTLIALGANPSHADGLGRTPLTGTQVPLRGRRLQASAEECDEIDQLLRRRRQTE